MDYGLIKSEHLAHSEKRFWEMKNFFEKHMAMLVVIDSPFFGESQKPLRKHVNPLQFRDKTLRDGFCYTMNFSRLMTSKTNYDDT